jgi:hypothetical protein
MERIVAFVICPPRPHDDSPVVHLAHRAQILPAHMRRLRAALALAWIVNPQDPSLMGGGARIRWEHF